MTGHIKPTARRARRYYRCDQRSAPWCVGIREGERHWVQAIPPGDNDLDNKTWWRMRECAACAEYCGRPLPEEAKAA